MNRNACHRDRVPAIRAFTALGIICHQAENKLLWREVMVYFLGDVHGNFEHIRRRGPRFRASAAALPSPVFWSASTKKLIRSESRDADLSRLGVATWHLSHQWPSSWVCLRHYRSLRVAVNGFIVQQANSWRLPGDLRENVGRQQKL